MFVLQTFFDLYIGLASNPFTAQFAGLILANRSSVYQVGRGLADSWLPPGSSDCLYDLSNSPQRQFCLRLFALPPKMKRKRQRHQTNSQFLNLVWLCQAAKAFDDCILETLFHTPHCVFPGAISAKILLTSPCPAALCDRIRKMICTFNSL